MFLFIFQIGTFVGILGIVIGVVLNGFINPRMFTSGWKIWFAAIAVPFFGFTFGYVLARILRQSHAKCRTIAFETGSQNVALTLTLIFLTFDEDPDFDDLMTFPSLYAIFIFVDAIIVVIVYKLVMHFKEKSQAELEVENTDESVQTKSVTMLDVVD